MQIKFLFILLVLFQSWIASAQEAKAIHVLLLNNYLAHARLVCVDQNQKQYLTNKYNEFRKRSFNEMGKVAKEEEAFLRKTFKTEKSMNEAFNSNQSRMANLISLKTIDDKNLCSDAEAILKDFIAEFSVAKLHKYALKIDRHISVSKMDFKGHQIQKNPETDSVRPNYKVE